MVALETWLCGSLLNTPIPKTFHKGLALCLLLTEAHGVIYVIFLQ